MHWIQYLQNPIYMFVQWKNFVLGIPVLPLCMASQLITQLYIVHYYIHLLSNLQSVQIVWCYFSHIKPEN